jgi:hypothetical protein
MGHVEVLRANEQALAITFGYRMGQLVDIHQRLAVRQYLDLNKSHVVSHSASDGWIATRSITNRCAVRVRPTPRFI